MQGSRVTSVGNPTSPMDAVNLQTLQGVVGQTKVGSSSSQVAAWTVKALNFSGANPQASITAPTGELDLSAGGANKNIVLSPSGTGEVRLSGEVLLVGDAQDQATLPAVTIAIEDTDASAGGGSGGRLARWFNRRNTTYLTQNISNTNGTWFLDSTGNGGAVFQLNNGALSLYFAPSGTATATLTQALIYLPGTGLAIGTNNPAFPLDVVGDINASGTLHSTSGTITNTLTAGAIDATGVGGFLANGIAGQTATIAYTSGAGTHTLTFSAGLLVGHI